MSKSRKREALQFALMTEAGRGPEGGACTATLTGLLLVPCRITTCMRMEDC